MDLKKISLEPVQARTVAILGYGNQGRAHALNLRDSGVRVLVGARPEGQAWKQAQADGFDPIRIKDAADRADVLMFLFPDQVIPTVYQDLGSLLTDKPRFVGFAHGFAYHFEFIPRHSNLSYFLVGPKGAGALLRQGFEKGGGLPAVFALSPKDSAPLRELCLSYAKAIGAASSVLLETTFQEETECDLFGEQAVLCGGIAELMEGAFETLVRNGHQPEMAFFECCFEAKMILELWFKYGPTGMSQKISPTAFYGGVSRGPRLVTSRTREEMEKIFQEIRGGSFAKEWMNEVKQGTPQLTAARNKLRESTLQKTYDRLRPNLPD